MNYTDEEKTNIIAPWKKGISVQQLSSQYGISVRTIYRWSKLYCEANLGEKRTFTLKEHNMAQSKQAEEYRYNFKNRKLYERYYYVCVILDLYSRMVIAYKISQKNSTQLITGTFKLAYNQRVP